MATNNTRASFPIVEFWIGGANSLLHPTDIPKGQYAWGENILNRGGIVQTRPGFRYHKGLDGELLQGMTIFTPSNSLPHMVVAIDGKIHVAQYPYTNFRILEGLTFSAVAKFVVFQPALKSVKRNEDGSLSLITPRRVLVMQDGSSLAGFWDGTENRHLLPAAPTLETPSGGLWMEWASSRLWVAKGSRLLASDIADPLSFSEDVYIAERSNFELPDQITAMIETSDRAGLLVFTDTSTTAFKCNIRDRTQWQTTPEFQRILFPSIGCVAGLSTVNQYGLTHWFTLAGLINLDTALQSEATARLMTTDGEMMRSKRNLATNLRSIASVAFENMLLVSVPSGNKRNAQTWVMDQAPLGQVGNGADRCWPGIWSGLRPVQWATDTINGREHCYAACHDKTAKDNTHIHIWEAFDETREDNDGGRIKCQFETPAYSAPIRRRFCYIEFEATEILGEVDLQVFFGGVRGPWLQIMDTTLQAEIGSIGSAAQQIITDDSVIEAYKPQSRILRTEEFSPQGEDCGVESDDAAGVDMAFALLFEWRGRMGIRGIRIVTRDHAQSDHGKCEEPEEDVHNILTERGETIEV